MTCCLYVCADGTVQSIPGWLQASQMARHGDERDNAFWRLFRAPIHMLLL